MARARTRAGLKTNALGTARPFIAGLENPRITALDALAWQAFTEVSGLNVEKTESTTITLPSDNDGFNYDEVTISYGGFQAQTFTLTEYMDERSNAPYLDAMLTDAPGSLWLPEGRNRRLSDPYDFQSGVLIDHFTVSADTKDDNANPSDGDPGNPNKISATGNFHGRNRHVVKPITLSSRTLTSSSGQNLTGVSFIDERETNAGVGRLFYAIESGTTGKKAKMHKRDAYGTWIAGVEVGANADITINLENAGTHFVTGIQDATTPANSAHLAIPVDTFSSALEVSHGALTSATQVPLEVWAKSPSEIWFAYGSVGTNSTAALGVAGSPTSSPVSKLAIATANRRFYTIHGLNDQIVAAGGSGNVSAKAEVALIRKSDDNGESWENVTAPSGAKGITSVFMTDADTFFMGDVTGKIWFTHDFGTTWTACSVDAGVDKITKIVFLWPEGAERSSRLGYVLAERSADNDSALYRSIDGGRNWVDRRSLMTADGSEVGNMMDVVVAGPQSIVLGGAGAVAEYSVR